MRNENGNLSSSILQNPNPRRKRTARWRRRGGKWQTKGRNASISVNFVFHQNIYTWCDDNAEHNTRLLTVAYSINTEKQYPLFCFRQLFWRSVICCVTTPMMIYNELWKRVGELAVTRRREAMLEVPGLECLQAAKWSEARRVRRSAVATLCRRVGRLPGDDYIALPLLCCDTIHVGVTTR